MPRVSVIIPTYNRSQLLKQAINSVLAQMFTDFEIIVVDDGSEDDTQAAVMGYGDDRIRYLRQENLGLSAARNTGVRNAQSDLVAFLDDDDLWLPQKLEDQARVFDQNPEVGLVSCGCNYIDEDGQFLQAQTPWLYWPALDINTWLFACPTFPTAVMVKRKWLEKVGGFDERVSPLSDWDLFLRLDAAGCQMTWEKQVLCAYRVHSSNMTRNVDLLRREMLGVLDRFYSTPGLKDDVMTLKNQAYARMSLRLAARAYSAGDITLAKNCLIQAVTDYPAYREQKGKPMLEVLLGFASDPLVAENPRAYLEAIFSNLPDELANLSGKRRWSLGYLAKQNLFRAHQQGRRSQVKHYFLKMLTISPGLMIDRGVWSAVVEAYFGSRFANVFRMITRRFKNN